MFGTCSPLSLNEFRSGSSFLIWDRRIVPTLDDVVSRTKSNSLCFFVVEEETGLRLEVSSQFYKIVGTTFRRVRDDSPTSSSPSLSRTVLDIK